jgi:hypothetical protein
MDKHRHVAVEVRDLAVPPFKRQFVGDGGYAQYRSHKKKVMPLSPGCELGRRLV